MQVYRRFGENTKRNWKIHKHTGNFNILSIIDEVEKRNGKRDGGRQRREKEREGERNFEDKRGRERICPRKDNEFKSLEKNLKNWINK